MVRMNDFDHIKYALLLWKPVIVHEIIFLNHFDHNFLTFNVRNIKLVWFYSILTIVYYTAKKPESVSMVTSDQRGGVRFIFSHFCSFFHEKE